MNIQYEHFRDAIEFLDELIAERGWHKNEPRCDYRLRYIQLENLLVAMQSEFQAQLPTLKDVQEVYRQVK